MISKLVDNFARKMEERKFLKEFNKILKKTTGVGDFGPNDRIEVRSLWSKYYDTKEDMEKDFSYRVCKYILNDIFVNYGDLYKNMIKECGGVDEFIDSVMWKSEWLDHLKEDIADKTFHCCDDGRQLKLYYTDPVVLEVWDKIRDTIVRTKFKNFYEYNIIDEYKDNDDEKIDEWHLKNIIHENNKVK